MPTKRRQWSMYLIAASFLAHAISVAIVCFWGPTEVGIETASGKATLVVTAVARVLPRFDQRAQDHYCWRDHLRG
jgi:hypothetical protein